MVVCKIYNYSKNKRKSNSLIQKKKISWYLWFLYPRHTTGCTRPQENLAWKSQDSTCHTQPWVTYSVCQFGSWSIVRACPRCCRQQWSPCPSRQPSWRLAGGGGVSKGKERRRKTVNETNITMQLWLHTFSEVLIGFCSIENSKERISCFPQHLFRFPTGYGLIQWHVDRSLNVAASKVVCWAHVYNDCPATLQRFDIWSL